MWVGWYCILLCQLSLFTLPISGSQPQLLAFIPVRQRLAVPCFISTQLLAKATDELIQIPPYLTTSQDTETEPPSYPSVLHSVHIKSVLSDEQSQKALALAQQYAASTGRWGQPDSDRHVTYATCDFPVEDAKELKSYLEHHVGLSSILWRHLNTCFGVPQEDMTYMDLFCAHYQAAVQKDDDDNGNDKDVGTSPSTTMDRLEAHRDGTLLSFTITLTPPDEFQGGGTFFEALKKKPTKEQSEKMSFSSSSPLLVQPGGVVRPSRAGDAVLHCGKLLHGAAPVTHGSRTVLVGFVDVADHCIRPGALAAACREWGRMDVAAKRCERQQQKAGETGKPVYVRPNNAVKWLPKSNPKVGQSCIQGFCPAFSSVKRRASPEFQRQRRLETEDMLLRTILLTEKERENHPTKLLSGDITIL